MNVRKGPSIKWKVIKQVDRDQLVLETRREGEWSEIFYLTPNKKVIKGWIFNAYLKPQEIEEPVKSSAQQFDVKASADQLVCADNTVVAIGSLCYLDIHFTVTAVNTDQRRAVVTCWADFVVPNRQEIRPIQTTGVDRFHLFGGKAEGTIRLKVGLDARVSRNEHNLAYFNCTAK